MAGIKSESPAGLNRNSHPLFGRKHAVCGSIERLPFHDAAFGCIVCVGEVLAYCDPAASLSEFSRVLAPSGILIFDFGSSRSSRLWLKQSFGRAAEVMVDEYNSSPEPVWRYDPNYIATLVTEFGFRIVSKSGIHTWSALGLRIGLRNNISVRLQRKLERLPLPTSWADIITIVALRLKDEK